MRQSDAPVFEVKPYKGPESYQVEDAGLFFGRDDEAQYLISKILSSRMVLLHARSSVGKTSLLNARVIPGLEKRGWSAVRILPQDDPVLSVRSSTLLALFPPPEAEWQAVRRARETLFPGGTDPSLNELLECYDRLPVWHSARRQLLAPIEASFSSLHGLLPSPARVTPVFCRLLRAGMSVEGFAGHLAAVLGCEGVGEGMPISRMEALLEASVAGRYYRDFLVELDAPVLELRAFFENLLETCSARGATFSLVLIFDQFEELFTRFVDPGVGQGCGLTGLPDWRLRWQFLEQMERLYRQGAEGEPGPPPLPIRQVISIRDEYVAQLDPIRQYVPELEESSYHLDFLGVPQAEAAIKEPADRYGYRYSDECYSEIIGKLTQEGRFVEPAHVQIVCEKLWNKSGRDLARRLAADPQPDERRSEIPLETLRTLGGPEGILDSYFRDFLEGLPSREARLETLEMLECLVTGSRTRNIVDRQALLEAPLRFPEVRKALLAKLVDANIVRVEPRLGGYFVEITHEFLIDPVLRAVREELANDPEHSRFRTALHVLAQSGYVGSPAAAAQVLTPQQFRTIHRHRGLIRWDDAASEVMVRGAIRLGAGEDVLREWLVRFGAAGHPFDVSQIPDSADMGGRLSLGQLGVVNQNRSHLSLSPGQIEVIFRSELALASDGEMADVEYWTRRFLEA